MEVTTFDDENEKPTPPSILQLPADPFRAWRELAKITAYNKLHEDLDQYDEPSPDEQLPAIARNFGRKELKNVPGITEKGKTIPELIDVYEETFVQSFRELLQEESNRGTIKDKTTLAVRRQARLDRSLALSDEQLPIHGVIQAIRVLLEYDIPFRYFQQIEELAKAYSQASRDNREVIRDYHSSF